MKTAISLSGIFAIIFALLCVSTAVAEPLDQRAGKAFRRIGIGPHQTEAYATAYEEFLKKRSSSVRRVVNRSQGEEVPVKAKKAARRAAKRSMKDMEKILTPKQLELYAEYIELDNQQFIRAAGLR